MRWHGFVHGAHVFVHILGFVPSIVLPRKRGQPSTLFVRHGKLFSKEAEWTDFSAQWLPDTFQATGRRAEKLALANYRASSVIGSNTSDHWQSLVSVLLRSGSAHCDLALAVEVQEWQLFRRGGEERGRRVFSENLRTLT